MNPSSLLGHIQEVLTEILSSGRPADRVFDGFFRKRKYLGPRDRRIIAENGYGTLRHLRRSQALLAETLAVEPEQLHEPEAVRGTLLAYLAACEDADGSGAVDAASLTGGVDPAERELVDRLREAYRRFLRRRDAGPGLVHSFPDWLVRRLAAEFPGEELDELLRALNMPAPLSLRVNTLRTTVEECRLRLEEEGVPANPGRCSPFALELTRRVNVFGLAAFRDGLFELQDEGSQMLPFLLDPKPTAKVLDACAGAGGKTLEFAALMRNRGEIVAGDVNSRRLGELRKRARRAGAFNVRVRELDLMQPLAPELQERFDLVFVDAPCTGVGTIRRNPGMKWSVSESMVRELAGKQLAMLSNGSGAVKPGGRLAYSTCTLFREENDDVVSSFLGMQPQFSLVPAAELGNSEAFIRRKEDPFLRLLPHRDGTDGFFLAVLQRHRM